MYELGVPPKTTTPTTTQPPGSTTPPTTTQPPGSTTPPATTQPTSSRPCTQADMTRAMKQGRAQNCTPVPGNTGRPTAGEPFFEANEDPEILEKRNFLDDIADKLGIDKIYVILGGATVLILFLGKK